MQRDGISVCLIAKDEEDVIASSLSSIQLLADEIIVVDTGSSDDTLSVARRYGARIIHQPWNDDFSGARNTALANASCSWILTLDCDEVIADKDIQAIKRLTKAKRVDGYLFEQRNYVDAYVDGLKPCSGEYKEEFNHIGYLPVPIVRLFRNHPSIRYVGRVHENVSHVAGGQLNIVDAGVPIHHYGKVRNPEMIAAKMREYLRLGEKKIAEDPENPKAYHEYAMVAWQQGDSERAASAFERTLELRIGSKTALIDAARFFSEHGRPAKAEKILEALIGEDEKDVDVLNALGSSCMHQGKHEEAASNFSRALESDPNNIYALRNIAAAYVNMRRPGRAIGYLKRLLDVNPKCHETYRYLGMAYESTREFNKAIAVYRRYIAECPRALDFVRQRFTHIQKSFASELACANRE